VTKAKVELKAEVVLMSSGPGIVDCLIDGRFVTVLPDARANQLIEAVRKREAGETADLKGV
jgi:hypothetical protein